MAKSLPSAYDLAWAHLEKLRKKRSVLDVQILNAEQVCNDLVLRDAPANTVLLPTRPLVSES